MDYAGILKRALDPKVNRDATPGGLSYVSVREFGQAEKEVFMGGTCNGSSWRDVFVTYMDTEKIPCFNPVVKDWNEEAQQAEEEAKLRCGIHLYVITPKAKGMYSVAEAVESAIVNPKGTYVVFMIKDGKHTFSPEQLRSNDAIIDLVQRYTNNFYTVADVDDLEKVARDIMRSKRGYADTMIIQMQSHPKSYGGWHGIQVYDMINICKSIIQWFNDKFGHPKNAETIKHLKYAKVTQEERTDERKARDVEGRDKE
jgi:hypothetical protein